MIPSDSRKLWINYLLDFLTFVILYLRELHNNLFSVFFSIRRVFVIGFAISSCQKIVIPNGTMQSKRIKIAHSCNKYLFRDHGQHEFQIIRLKFILVRKYCSFDVVSLCTTILKSSLKYCSGYKNSAPGTSLSFSYF